MHIKLTRAQFSQDFVEGAGLDFLQHGGSLDLWRICLRL
jgi:hypothetical protein